MNIVLRKPLDLAPHKRIKHLHRWDPKDERFLRFVAEVKLVGIKQPLQITGKGEVIDGELRRQVAAKAHFETVPCVIVPDDEVGQVILGSICNRRHYTKGQRAFMLAPELAQHFQDGIRRNWEVLKSGGKVAADGPPVHTAEHYAEQYGLSARLLEQARQVHKIFEEDTGYAKQMEPRIFDEDDPAGLGAVIAGYAGQKSTKGKPKVKRHNEQLELFGEAWTTLGKRFTYWTKLNEEARLEVLPKLRSAIAAMPPDLRTELKRAIKAAEREEAAS